MHCNSPYSSSHRTHSFDLGGGGGTFDGTEIFRCKVDLHGSEVFFSAMQLGGARNRNASRLLGKQPSKCQLSWWWVRGGIFKGGWSACGRSECRWLIWILRSALRCGRNIFVGIRRYPMFVAERSNSGIFAAGSETSPVVAIAVLRNVM